MGMMIYTGSPMEQVLYTADRIKKAENSMIISDREDFLYKKYADKLREKGFRVMHLDCSADSIGFNPYIPTDNPSRTIWDMTGFFIRTENKYCRTAERNLLHTACMYVLERNEKRMGIFDCIGEAVELLDTIIESKDYIDSEYYIRISEFAKENPRSETAESYRATSFIRKKIIKNLTAEITMQFVFWNFLDRNAERIDLSVFAEEKAILFINGSYKHYFDNATAYMYYYILNEYKSRKKIEMITDYWENSLPLYCGRNNIEVTLLAVNKGNELTGRLKGNTICIMK